MASIANIQQQTVSIVFNALALANYQPQLFRVRDGGSVLDLITVDATLSEVISRDAEVTDHPVEVTDNDVSSVSDHVRLRPLELHMEGVVSDTPWRQSELIAALQAVPPIFGLNLGIAGTAATAFADPKQGTLLAAVSTRAQRAYDDLVNIFEDHELVTLVTPRETLDSMMMTQLVVTRDPHTGAGLRFAAAFKEVVTVSDKIVSLPAVTQPPFDLGNQPTKPAPAGVQENVSGLIKLNKSIGTPLPPPIPKGTIFNGTRF